MLSLPQISLIISSPSIQILHPPKMLGRGATAWGHVSPCHSQPPTRLKLVYGFVCRILQI